MFWEKIITLKCLWHICLQPNTNIFILAVSLYRKQKMKIIEGGGYFGSSPQCITRCLYTNSALHAHFPTTHTHPHPHAHTQEMLVNSYHMASLGEKGLPGNPPTHSTLVYVCCCSCKMTCWPWLYIWYTLNSLAKHSMG